MFLNFVEASNGTWRRSTSIVRTRIASNQGNKIIHTNNSFFTTGGGREEKSSRQPDKFNPKQIKEVLTLLNEQLAQ